MKTKKRTQIEDILKYMQTHKKGISSYDAFRLFGATRLSGRVFELKKRGYHIVGDDISKKNRYGTMTTYTVYRLEK